MSGLGSSSLINPKPPVTIEFGSSGVDPSNLSVYTFANAAIGTPDPTRKVVVAVTRAAGGGGDGVVSVTVGGISASQVVATLHGDHTQTELWQVNVPTGSTADIVITWNASPSMCGYGCWAIYNAADVPYDTGSVTNAGPCTDTINVPAKGVCVASTANSRATFPTTSWTGLTEDWDELIETAPGHSGAHQAFDTEQVGLTVTATTSLSVNYHAMSLASWGQP